MLEIGQKLPQFSLFTQDGVEFSSEELLGKWSVIYFYPKDSTPGCTKEACAFSENLPDFSALNAVVIGISADSIQSHKKFETKFDLKIKLLSDPDKIALKAFGAWGLKKNYGKEYEGIIRSTFIIAPNGEIAAVWKAVKVENHAQMVLKKLNELQK